MSDQRPSKERVCAVCAEPWVLGHRCAPTPVSEQVNHLYVLQNHEDFHEAFSPALSQAIEWAVQKLRAPDEPRAVETRTVTIPACEQHHGVHKISVTIPWVCPTCSGPRGKIEPRLSYDGSLRLAVDAWTNPCGHVDKYSAVRQEAAALAARASRPPGDDLDAMRRDASRYEWLREAFGRIVFHHDGDAITRIDRHGSAIVFDPGSLDRAIDSALEEDDRAAVTKSGGCDHDPMSQGSTLECDERGALKCSNCTELHGPATHETLEQRQRELPADAKAVLYGRMGELYRKDAPDETSALREPKCAKCSKPAIGFWNDVDLCEDHFGVRGPAR